MSYERLLRLEHQVDCLESAPITFDLKPFLMSLKAEEIHETTLDGNMRLKGMKRFKFHRLYQQTQALRREIRMQRIVTRNYYESHADQSFWTQA
uniref:Uncharacterized protein n=1 Tax=Glossina palpalis gambiensis TaxID=67801 RepID=A0A1B0AWT9_9MUSC